VDSIAGKRVSFTGFLGRPRNEAIDAAKKADAKLDRICRHFDFLLSVSPINTHQAFEQFRARQPDLNFGDIAERLLPFTSVNREFKGDRYSEFRRRRGIFRSRKFDRIPLFQQSIFYRAVPADADFVTQTEITQKVAFRRHG